jgi:hypothetical protein
MLNKYLDIFRYSSFRDSTATLPLFFSFLLILYIFLIYKNYFCMNVCVHIVLTGKLMLNKSICLKRFINHPFHNKFKMCNILYAYFFIIHLHTFSAVTFPLNFIKIIPQISNIHFKIFPRPFMLYKMKLKHTKTKS